MRRDESKAEVIQPLHRHGSLPGTYVAG